MKFYEKYYTNCYEELLTYYPDFYKGVYEMNEILKTFGALSDDLEASVEQTFFNNFILTADVGTIRIWENMLHITYNESLTLQQQRQVIIGYLCSGKHMGETEIRDIVGNYTENPADVDFVNGVVLIVVYGEIFSERSLISTLRQKIPAHLSINISFILPRIFKDSLRQSHGCFERTRVISKSVK